MMKKDLGYRTGYLLFVVLILVSATAASCKRDESAPAKTASQTPAINPYSSGSVLEEVQKKLEKNPNDVEALYHLADLYDRDAQYAEAIETYKKVIKLKPDMGYAYFKLGTAYDRTDQSKEAVNAFKKSIEYMPRYAMTYNNLGVAYGKLGKLNDEIAALKKAIGLRPNFSLARYNLGVTYLRTGNKKAAMQEYESLKKFDDGTAEALMKEIKKTV